MPITSTGGPSSLLSSGSSGIPMNGTPALNLPGFNQPSAVNGSALSISPTTVLQLLGQAQPQSIANTIGPLLSQVFGSQANMMQPLFQQQTNQGVASAQSNAMQRGLTGSSIEAANMSAAQAQGNQAYNQYLAGQLNSLVPQYTQALGQDVSNQTNYMNTLAQGVGGAYSQQLQQQDFQQQMSTLLQQAGITANAQEWSAGIGAAGDVLSSAMPTNGLSDIRLKENIEKVGEWRGFNIYSFNFKDNDLDLPKGKQIGFMAHEVMNKRPDCVELEKGYLKVNYRRLLDA